MGSGERASSVTGETVNNDDQVGEVDKNELFERVLEVNHLI